MLFGAGSLFCGLSQDFGSFTLLLAARVVQAVGGGGIVPVATAEFGTTFPAEKRGMALGLVGGVYGIANIFGSSAGSAILDLFGSNNWKFIFYINIPITIFVIVAGFFALPNNKAENVSKIDKYGILLIVTMILSLLYGLKNIDFFNFTDSITSRDVYPFLLLFIILLPLFILAEKRADDPVMNLNYFTNPRIVITLAISFLTGIVMMGMIFIPQFSENAVKIAAGSGGFCAIILGRFAGAGAPMSGRFTDKFGAKMVLVFGFAVSIIGSLFLIFITVKYPSTLTVVISLILMGLGMGFTIGAPLNYMMLENTRKEESNSALAALSLIRSIGTTIAPAIMIGFIAHAGAAVQEREMALLPKSIMAPELPYAQELTDRIEKLKADPNMKDKLGEIEMPDLASMAEINIDMNGNDSYKMPEDLLELMKSADVTNITERIKILADRMFSEMTPDVIANIQKGVLAGIEGIKSGIPNMDKSTSELKSGIDGITKGIAGMQEAAAGMEEGTMQMEKAVEAQNAALLQMNRLYSQMVDVIGNTDAGIPVSDMTTAMPSGNFSIINMIPQDVKAKISANVLEMLKDIKTPADLKEKTTELSNTISTLKREISDLKKQRGEMLTKINETELQRKQMLEAASSIQAAKEDMNDTIDKMTKLKDAIPEAFEKVKDNYLMEIDELAPQLESEFQNVLNSGFKQVYLTTAIAAIICVLILLFYKKKVTS